MLQIVDLVKRYGKFVAVNKLSLTIEKGSIFGFVGPNGAGKTTTMKIISGLLSATEGTVLINDVDVTRNPMKLRGKIGYMPDFFGVYDNLKVNEYMDFYAGAYYIPYKERPAIIDNLLELVDLVHKKNNYVDTLSRGMKQRLCLARSLVHDPDVLILDEPASGLDPIARVEMKEILKQLKNLGKTIIISSHILTELSQMCTTIGIINQGNLAAFGTIDEIMRKINKNREVYLKPLEMSEELLKILQEKPTVDSIMENTDDLSFYFAGNDKDLADLVTEIVTKDIPLITVKEKETDLEDLFTQIVLRRDEND